MDFYDLSKEKRVALSAKIGRELEQGLSKRKNAAWLKYFSDRDTYIRKAAYLQAARIWNSKNDSGSSLLNLLAALQESADPLVRQTAINAAGEIGKKDFSAVQTFFDRGLFDAHHAPRNAVIGCIKKMGEVNPAPVLKWSRRYLRHPDKEVRREICHGIELRGRKYPAEILPMLRELEFDRESRVKKTLVHVLGQIAYKKGCLEIVLAELRSWENVDLVKEAVKEIIDVHKRYSDFAALSVKEAKALIGRYF